MHAKNHDTGLKSLALLSLGALGVVFGDIGTSPLYAINEIFFGKAHVALEKANILGSISLVFWALTIVICIKYVLLVLRADNEGEGGVFSLYSLIVKKISNKKHLWIAGLLIFSSGLLFGDGMITPAISVISAVEGLKVIAPSLSNLVVPITIVILTLLFIFQKKGTHKVGKVFGPIVAFWFLNLGILGLAQIIKAPEILGAINPYYGIKFLLENGIGRNLFILGSVMLVITGGEALYADMGHFGRSPIRLSWFSMVYPALLMNYLGQGAFLLRGAEVVNENIFFSTVPQWYLIPSIILATMATVIASQALISGAYSIASQAIHLGLLPRLQIVHTHEDHEGQIYIPFINWLLYFGCIFFVVTFRSSANLANAYGLAVNGDMIITTISMIAISRYLWNWNIVKSLAIFLPILIIDFSFLSANLIKIPAGGYIPLLIGVGFYSIMKTWQWGRREVRKVFRDYSSMTITDLIKIKKGSDFSLPRTIIIMTPFKVQSAKDVLPPIKQIFWERYGVLPKDLIFLTVNSLRQPYASRPRYDVNEFYKDPKKGSITGLTLNYGFMEDPNVESTLKSLNKNNVIQIADNPEEWLIHTSKAKLIYPTNISIITRTKLVLLEMMFRMFNTSDHYFGVGNKVKLTTEVIPVTLKLPAFFTLRIV